MIKSEVLNGSVSTGNGNSNHNLSPAQVQEAKQNQLRQLQLQQQQQHQQQLKHRAALQNHHFTSTTEEILRKYSKYPASLSLHIFETHYRFNNSQDSQIIPKNSPMMKDFMQHVLKEEIPIEMCELIKDFAIRPYDGCIILQVYDHRNMVKTAALPNRAAVSPTKDQENKQPTIVLKPRSYRTLLKPTPLSIYYDLLYHTDSALHRFTDYLSLQMESEILTVTNRKLNLDVPLNPYNYEHLKPETESHVKDGIQDDEETTEFVHRHAVQHTPRKIHQDEMVLHKSSEYEEIMLLLSNKSRRPDESQDKKLVVVNSSTLPTTSTPTAAQSTKQNGSEPTANAETKSKKGEKTTSTAASTAAPTPAPAPAPSIPQNPVRATGQFMRLRLIEEIRKKERSRENSTRS